MDGILTIREGNEEIFLAKYLLFKIRQQVRTPQLLCGAMLALEKQQREHTLRDC